MEKVDYLLEQMLPELNDLKDNKIFNQMEIREIVKRRTAFERSLVRRVARKEDFLRYIEYELNLEELRKIRFNRQKNAHTKHSLSSYSLQRRILSLFDRATRKFKGDVGLWVQYAEVAKKQGAKKLVGKILASALLQHPTSPTVYVLLSSYELTENLSPTSARTLLQRGLRLIPHSVHLWTEYAKMELVWVERLRRRWDILGVKDPEYDAEQAAGRRAVMEGAVVRVVWSSALKALPADLKLYQSFINLFRAFPTPLRMGLLEMVYEDLMSAENGLGGKAESWMILAGKGFEDKEYSPDEGKEREPLEGRALIDAIKSMVAGFKKGVETLEGREQGRLLEIFANQVRAWEAKVEDDGLKAYLQHHLSTLLKPPHTTPAIHASHINHLLSSSTPLPPSQILTFCRKATTLFPASPTTWAARLVAEIRFEDAHSPKAGETLPELVQTSISVGLQSTSEDEEASRAMLWDAVFLYLSTIGERAEQLKQVHRLLQQSLRSTSTSSSSLPTHTHLLSLSLPLLHPVPELKLPGSVDAPAPLSIKHRLETFALIKARYLPTAAFYRAVFEHESLFPASRPVLEHIYDGWRSKFGGGAVEDEVECHLTWLEYLWAQGEHKGLRECLKRLMGAGGASSGLKEGGVGAAVVERWQAFLGEKEREEKERREEEEVEEEEEGAMQVEELQV